MVVIEVDRDYESFENLLGLHTWSEFLQRPTQEELDKVSKVFYCAYNTGRIVEKNGLSHVVLVVALLYLCCVRRLETREYRGTLVLWLVRQQCVSGVYIS